MSFIIAGLALLLALIASILLDGTSSERKRDATSHPFMRDEPKHPFMRNEPKHEADAGGVEAQPQAVTFLMDGQ